VWAVARGSQRSWAGPGRANTSAHHSGFQAPPFASPPALGHTWHWPTRERQFAPSPQPRAQLQGAACRTRTPLRRQPPEQHRSLRIAVTFRSARIVALATRRSRRRPTGISSNIPWCSTPPLMRRCARHNHILPLLIARPLCRICGWETACEIVQCRDSPPPPVQRCAPTYCLHSGCNRAAARKPLKPPPLPAPPAGPAQGHEGERRQAWTHPPLERRPWLHPPLDRRPWPPYPTRPHHPSRRRAWAATRAL
jgi:hypothetical protein